jgi:hypothetical protein
VEILTATIFRVEAPSSTPRPKAAGSSEVLENFYHTTGCHVPEGNMSTVTTTRTINITNVLGHLTVLSETFFHQAEASSGN